MENLREYVVTANSRECLDSLCEDIESEGGSLHIPNRQVKIANPRPMSRSTHYYLTDEEANLLRQDQRVLAAELMPTELGMTIKPSYTQTETTWNRSTGNNSTHKNWGLLRTVEGVQRTNWGSDGPVNSRSQTGTINVNASGRQVDVVIVDGHFNPEHPEYAINPDGTGGSRAIQFNWFQLNPTVTGGASGTYVYTPYVDAANPTRTSDNNHGAHVAGTVAGNSQGWARNSTIYNINPYSTNNNSFDALFLFDYIRAWHLSKPINPETGQKNPTIINNSWGYGYQLPVSGVLQIINKDVVVADGTPVSTADLDQYGIFNNGVDVFAPARYPALDADLEDAIAAGIVVVGAASNDYSKIDIPTGLDYNNRFVWTDGTFNYNIFYHRGSSPTSTNGAICVGAVSSTVAEPKADFSNCGPRVDIYAPGQHIISSVNSNGVADPRNSSYFISKFSGTSMASPQVCGVLACALEVYPNMNQTQALTYIAYYAKPAQLFDSAGGYSDYSSLQGSSNTALFYYKERPDSGQTWPKINYFVRPSSGSVYPRAKIRR